MTDREALDILRDILPHRLSFLQEAIFVGTWSGKIYREIATDCGYELDYVRAVGSQLWEELTRIVGQRVTKKNLRFIFENRLQSAQPLQDQWISPPEQSDSPPFPGGVVPLNSKFYIERPAIETLAYTEISKPGSLIRIKAPRQMGKTSLAHRILAHAKSIGCRVVLLKVQEADRALFQDLDRFLRWFCINIAMQLNLEPRIEEYWSEDIGSKVSLKTYFREYLLRNANRPIVLALDEVNLIFQYPELSYDFLPLLRSLHEEASDNDIWARLRLIVIHSTEIYIPLQISQSPFNVGVPILLPELTLEQMQDLAERYELMTEPHKINRAALELLTCLVGGHPYLVQLAFYQLKYSELSVHQLIQQAVTQTGIYSHYLRGLLETLQQQPDLKQAYQQVIASSSGIELESITAYRLESMGLIKLQGNRAVPRCKLYRHYFNTQFTANDGT